MKTKKKLSDMTLEELWTLFPILLLPHNPQYSNWFLEEKIYLENILPSESIYRINHIGSSAVEGLISKNIIDILLEAQEKEDLVTLSEILSTNGWTVMSKRLDNNPQISLNKGYTEEGYAEKVFHLHLRLKGDWAELYFRDYLKDNFAVAKAYEKLKIDSAQKNLKNRDAYTAQKTDFIKKHSEIAKENYTDRYLP